VHLHRAAIVLVQDLDYMKDLMRLMEERQIPAPAPIEQRWTASSSAPMSPAHSINPEDTHSWVGIIMYLPSDEPEFRADVTNAFSQYALVCERDLMPKYGAKWHWAKLEPGSEPERMEWIRQYLKERYNIINFNHVRRTLDPENNFGNDWLNNIIPLTRS
jgi:L-galactono-1,4-lactone dehydrogenase